MVTMPESQSLVQSPAPSAQRNRLSFSLRSLLLFSVLAVLIVSHLNTNYQWQRERAENQAVRKSLQQEVEALRTELGYFRVDPKEQAHILCLPQVESGHYVWRVYLPPDTKWRLQLEAAHSVGDGGKSSSSHSSQLEPGEFVLHVKLIHAEDGSWKLGLMLPNRSSTIGLQTNTAFAASSYSSTESIGGRKLERYDSDQEIKLLTLECDANSEKGGIKETLRDEIRVLIRPDKSVAPPSEKGPPAVE